MLDLFFFIGYCTSTLKTVYIFTTYLFLYFFSFLDQITQDVTTVVWLSIHGISEPKGL